MTSEPELHLESSTNFRREDDPTVQHPAAITSQLASISDGATGGCHSKTLHVRALPTPPTASKNGEKKQTKKKPSAAGSNMQEMQLHQHPLPFLR